MNLPYATQMLLYTHIYADIVGFIWKLDIGTTWRKLILFKLTALENTRIRLTTAEAIPS